MAEVILMPRLSDTMTEGVIAAWHKKVGDQVKKGELLAEVETDKATMELESYKDGTLLHIGIDQGGKLQVNDLLGVIGQPGEDISALLKEKKNAVPNGQKQAENATQQTQPATKSEGQEQKQAQPAAKTTSQPAPAATKQPETNMQQSTSTATQTDISKMEEVVLMPRLSDTMTEGVIAAWHKKVGDQIKKGDLLAEIETDKATMELESYKDGKLLHIGAEKGQKIAVNELLAIIGDEKKIDVPKILEAINAKGTGGAQQAAMPAAKQEQQQASSKQETQQAPAKQEPQQTTGKQEQQQAAQQPEDDQSTNGRIKASPLAKKLAAEKGIDISTIHGTGDGGRITKADIDSFAPARQEAGTEAPRQSAQPKAQPSTAKIPIATSVPGEEGYTDNNNSQMRNAVARRLIESKYNAPHFYLTMEINMDSAMSSRAQMNELSPVKISFQDMIIKACAMALRQHPAVNSSWMGDFIRTYKHIHIGSAVAVPDGLIVPVIRFADHKSLSQIAGEAKELYEKARNKKLQPAEFTGNTFTISNLGMMDIDEFTAIINPPDSAILAVGRIKEIVTRKDNGFGVTNVMKVTMSCDHRSVDGAVGAAFLQTLKMYLENPVTMLV